MMALEMVFWAAVWVLLWFLPMVAGLWLTYYCLSLPLRRHERARLFLDVIESGLKSGQAPEQVIVSVSRSRDPSFGVRFHWLAALLEMGRPLGVALGEVPHLLPPRVRSMLRVGLESGSVERVLPACRHQLGDGLSQARGALNYAVVMLFATTPVFPGVLGLLVVFVFPKLVAIQEEMGLESPVLLQAVLAYAQPVLWVSAAMVGALYAVAVAYIGGPRVTGWLRVGGERVADRVAWRVPWKRSRLRRDFAALLAHLLDGGMPEAEAVRMAAAGVDNAVVRRQAERVVADLRSGCALDQALARVDDRLELAWRVRNAAMGPGGFRVALAGWLASLDARAFRQEQSAAHGLTTAVVLFNGVMVGFLVVGTFQVLVTIVNEGVLW